MSDVYGVFFVARLVKHTPRARTRLLKVPSKAVKMLPSEDVVCHLKGGFRTEVKKLENFLETAASESEKGVKGYWMSRVTTLPRKILPLLAVLGEFWAWEMVISLYLLETGQGKLAAILLEALRRKYLAYGQTSEFWGAEALDDAIAELVRDALEAPLMGPLSRELNELLNPNIYKGFSDVAGYRLALREALFSLATVLTRYGESRAEVCEPFSNAFGFLAEHYYRLALDPEAREKKLGSAVLLGPIPSPNGAPMLPTHIAERAAVTLTQAYRLLSKRAKYGTDEAEAARLLSGALRTLYPRWSPRSANWGRPRLDLYIVGEALERVEGAEALLELAVRTSPSEDLEEALGKVREGLAELAKLIDAELETKHY